MANELTMNASINYSDSEGTTLYRVISGLIASVATKKCLSAKQNIGTSEEAINLGEVTSPGWAIFVNLDATNYIELRVATAGAKFAKLLPGEFALLRLGAGAQVPYAIANTAACQMEYQVYMT